MAESIPGRRPVDPYFDADPVSLGIDVSYAQGVIDWKQVAAARFPNLRDNRIRFAFIRLGDGEGIDRYFDANWRGAGEAGLRRGAYRYFRAREGGARMAAVDTDLIAKAGGFSLGDLRPACDIEERSQNDEAGTPNAISNEVLLAEARAYLKGMESGTKRRGLVYSGAFIHGLAIRMRRAPTELTGWPIWSPAYTAHAMIPHGWDKLAFWQFTSRASVPGIRVDCDLNYFRGGAIALGAWAYASSIFTVPVALATVALVGTGTVLYLTRS